MTCIWVYKEHISNIFDRWSESDLEIRPLSRLYIIGHLNFTIRIRIWNDSRKKIILKLFEANKEKWVWNKVHSWEKKKSKISLKDLVLTVKKSENGIVGMFALLPAIILHFRFDLSTSADLIFRFMRDCPTGKLQKSEFVAIYKELFPNGNAKTFSEFIFNVFDADGNGTIEAGFQNKLDFIYVSDY